MCSARKKAHRLVNDANRYAVETVGNPAYPLELFQRIITVSLETMRIVRELPKLQIAEGGQIADRRHTTTDAKGHRGTDRDGHDKVR